MGIIEFFTPYPSLLHWFASPCVGLLMGWTLFCYCGILWLETTSRRRCSNKPTEKLSLRPLLPQGLREQARVYPL